MERSAEFNQPVYVKAVLNRNQDMYYIGEEILLLFPQEKKSCGYHKDE